MADINYINYGDQLIDQLALLNNLADNVLKYVASLPWSRRRKEKFMSAYSDIINRGIQGASSKTGQWVINVGGDTLNLDELSKKDREMYQEAAYFIRHLMASLPIKEEEKKETPVLSNEQFLKDFGNYLGTSEFGGRKYDIKTDWTGLDTERDSEGKLSTKNRRAILARALEGYSKSIKDNQYNFEGSPFTDLNNFRTRILNAINAINTDTPDDDNEALNKLGLKASDWFYNGTTEDLSSVINPKTGELQTQEQANLQKEPTTKEPEKTVDSHPFAFISRTGKYSGKTPTELMLIYNNNLNLLLKDLLAYSQKHIGELTPEEYSKLYGAYKYLTGRFNPNDLERFKIKDKNLWNILKTYKTFSNIAPNDLRMLPDINNLIFDTRTGKLYQIDTKENYKAYLDSKFDLFKYIQPEEAKEALERLKVKDRGLFSGIGHILGLTDNERYKDPDGSINWTNVFKDTGVDVLRTLAGFEDIVAAGAAFVPGIGTAMSAAVSVDALLKELAADVLDDGVSFGDVGVNLLTNTGLAAISLVPFGKLAKFVPKLTKIAKIAMPAIQSLTSGAATGVLLSDENVRNSWEKLSHPTDMNSDDFRNILLVLGSVAGIASGVRGTATGIKGTRSSGSSKTVKEIAVENSKTGKTELVQLTKKLLSEMNERGRTGGNEAAKDYLNKNVERTAANTDIEYSLPKDFKYSTNKFNNSRFNPFKKWTSPTIKGVNVLTEPVRTPAQQQRFDLWKKRSEQIKKGPLGKLFGEVPTSFETYHGRISSTPVTEAPVIDSSTGGRKVTNSTGNQSTIPPELIQLIKGDKDALKGMLIYNRAKRGNFNIGPFNEEPTNMYGVSVLMMDVSSAAGPRFMVKLGNSRRFTSSKAEAQKLIFQFLLKKFNQKIGKDFKNVEKIKELATYLTELEGKGILKLGGRIDKQKIQKYKDFINK